MGLKGDGCSGLVAMSLIDRSNEAFSQLFFPFFPFSLLLWFTMGENES